MSAIPTLALCLPLLFSSAQEEGGRKRPDLPVPPTPELPSGGRDVIVHDAQGKVLRPGVLPEGVSAEAREAWRRLLASTRAPDPLGRERTPAPIQGFNLSFDVRVDDGQGRKNQFQMGYMFDAGTGHLRATVQDSRQLLHGPDGDFFVERIEVPNPDGGRARTEFRAHPFTKENDQDKRQLADMASIARNFIALSDPANLRIYNLSILPTAPTNLPADVAEEAAKLQWLEVQSPDFGLTELRSGGAAGSLEDHGQPTIYRALFGLDKAASHRISMVLVSSGGRGGSRPVLVEVDGLRDLDQFRVPSVLSIREYIPSERTFTAFAGTKLWMKKRSSLRPKFRGDEFRKSWR